MWYRHLITGPWVFCMFFSTGFLLVGVASSAPNSKLLVAAVADAVSVANDMTEQVDIHTLLLFLSLTLSVYLFAWS